MKICYLLMQWPKDSEAFVAVDIHTLAAFGHTVTVKSFRPSPRAAAPMLEERNVATIAATFPRLSDLFFLALRGGDFAFLLSSVLRARPFHLRQALKSLFLIPRAVRIADEIRRESPDVVHAFWGHYPALVLGLIDRQGPSRPVLTTSLRAYDLEMGYAPGLAIARSVADRVFTHAEINRARLESLGISADRLRVIRAGVDPDWLRPVERRADETFTLLSVGRLVACKGHDDVIRAVADLRRSGRRNVRLTVLGDGPDLSRLRGLAHDLGIDQFVAFAGHVPHGQVRELLGQADGLALMSWYSAERLPNVVKEAMACGCVCVAARSPGMEELILQDQTGWIVAPRDWRDLATRVARLIDDPAGKKDMAQAARSWVAKEFNAHIQQARYVAVWEECRRTLAQDEPVSVGRPSPDERQQGRVPPDPLTGVGA